MQKNERKQLELSAIGKLLIKNPEFKLIGLKDKTKTGYEKTYFKKNTTNGKISEISYREFQILNRTNTELLKGFAFPELSIVLLITQEIFPNGDRRNNKIMNLGYLAYKGSIEFIIPVASGIAESRFKRLCEPLLAKNADEKTIIDSIFLQSILNHLPTYLPSFPIYSGEELQAKTETALKYLHIENTIIEARKKAEETKNDKITEEEFVAEFVANYKRNDIFPRETEKVYREIYKETRNKFETSFETKFDILLSAYQYRKHLNSLPIENPAIMAQRQAIIAEQTKLIEFLDSKIL